MEGLNYTGKKRIKTLLCIDEDKDDPSFEPGDNPGQKKKVTFKPASMVDMKPCDDLHRYLVDKFHSSTKSKSVLFEEIDFSAYKSAAKVVSFVTSEDRLLLWIKTFAVRYFDHLNVMGYRGVSGKLRPKT